MSQTVQILKNKVKVADKVVVAESFLTRARGLLGRKSFEPGFGMLFPNCNNIHMWFMSVPLDVVFLKKEKNAYRVSSVHENVQPWKLLPLADFRASETLEFPIGTIRANALREGDVLEFENRKMSYGSV